MAYEVYVIANSDLFREGFNAVAAFCGSSSFKTATWLGTMVGFMMVAYGYTKDKDVKTYVKWLASYMIVFNVLLGNTSGVEIINTSDPTVAAQRVDNVPFGIAYPAHFITTLGHTFTEGLEEAFALPDDIQYHKTGMMFGSNLFRLSLSATIDDPTIVSRMNGYVRSCVVGDILVNHKYTFKDVLDSKDLWTLVTSNPSPIRGVFVDGKFQTCQEETKNLTTLMNSYVSDKASSHLARLVPSSNAYTGEAISSMLQSSYNYFQQAGQTSTDILKQNLAINAFRSGLRNYAAEVGSVAGLENINNTMAMMKVRLSWANSHHIGVETLPLMQVVLLLLMLCVFPFVAVLAMLPGMGYSVLKNYIYSLMWLETWPVMYAILNMAVNFYLRSKSGGTVTLSNINLIAQEHSDIAGIAGYLVLAIPFLSMGIVKGMASTFNSAAQYIGGMMHSIAQGTSAGVAMGNYSLGNVSTHNATANNISANKHDTNFTDMGGMATTQLSNGSLVTQTASGANVYNTHGAMSQLATRVDFAHGISSSLSQRADSSITSATNAMQSFSHTKGHNSTQSDGSSSNERAEAMQALNHNISMATALAKKEGISVSEAHTKMRQAGIQGSIGGSIKVGKELGLGASVSASGDIKGQATATHGHSHQSGVDKNISDSDAKSYAESESKVRAYAKTHSESSQNSQAENLLVQTGSSLNKAYNLSNSAQYVDNHSASINTNMAQTVASQIRSEHPNMANRVLSATEGKDLNIQNKLINQAIEKRTDEIASGYNADQQNVRDRVNVSGLNMKKYAMSNFKQEPSEISGSDMSKIKKDIGKGMNALKSERLVFEGSSQKAMDKGLKESHRKVPNKLSSHMKDVL